MTAVRLSSANIWSLAGMVLALGTLASGSGCRAARGASPPPSPLVGTWRYQDGAELTATCGDATIQERLAGATVAIRPDESTGVWFDIGCRCHLHLTAPDSDPNHLRLEQRADCSFVYTTMAFDVTVEALTLDLDPNSGTAHLDLKTGMAETPMTGPCASSALTANLSRSAEAPMECGPDTSALGVIPYAIKAQRSCPFGAGREGLLMVSDYDGQRDCDPSYTGWWNESQWSLPQTAKSEGSCRDHDPKGPKRQMSQLFCRVDGRAFKPLTTDPQATDQFYAVLKLSDEGQPCPNGSVEMVRRMDTEDTNNEGRAVGAIGPNQVITIPASNATILHFCFFRWADNPADTMQDFPDLGFPYAVYHDFDEPQPPWVTLKRWYRIINEQNSNSNDLSSPVPNLAPLAIEQFRKLVETPDAATVFDIAWVR